jgi:nucleotide-binding universal stress UspA family protein
VVSNVEVVMSGHKQLIVCGVDGSPASRRAVEWAVAEAVMREASLRVVTAWSGYGMEAIAVVSTPEDAEREAGRAQQRVVDGVLAGVEKPPAVERVVVEDRPAHALVTASLDADLLVMGSHGHNGTHDRVAGSTSQRVLHHAACAVVVLPDPRCAERTRKHAGMPGEGAEVAGAV